MVNDEIEKIAQRQSVAAVEFRFITWEELRLFLERCEQDPKLVAGYYALSTGWNSRAQHKAVSKKIAAYIKKNIK